MTEDRNQSGDHMDALAGIRVIDLTHHISGPTCTMLLGDYGAEVLKVEPLEGDPIRAINVANFGGLKATFLAVNRNKRSIAVDLRTEQGKALVLDMIRNADVFVENFRPGVAQRLGLGYETLSEENPRLVYCSINGFGDKSAYRDRRALDLVLQAMGGMMSITGEPGGNPLPSGAPVADYMAGLQGFTGVLLALQARERTGRGQRVSASMLNAVMSAMSLRIQQFWATGVDLRPIGSQHEQVMPQGAYHGSDGYFVVAVSTEPFWRRFCEAIEHPEWVEQPDYATNMLRVTHRESLNAKLNEVFKTRSRTFWLERLVNAGVPCGPVNSIGDIVDDEQIRNSGIFATMQHPHQGGGTIPVVGPPVQLSDTPGHIRRSPPLLGEHTRQVLSELGIDDAVVQDLISKGVVATS